MPVDGDPDRPPHRAGRYRLGRMLGRGSFATVWEGTHTELATLRVAVKVLHAQWSESPGTRRRFLREAETVASLQDANIARVLDCGELPDGRLWMAMEYVEGRPLDAVLRQAGRLADLHVSWIARGVLAALRAAHAANTAHRDIKPANLFVVQSGGRGNPDVRVLDFGIAKTLSAEGRAAPAGTHTIAGQVLCTVHYAAPELLSTEGELASDLYALGHVMAELLDGWVPYAYVENPFLVAAEHLADAPVPLGPYASASVLRPIIERALQKNIALRYASADEMLLELESLHATAFGASDAVEVLDPEQPQWREPSVPHAGAPSVVVADSTRVVSRAAPNASGREAVLTGDPTLVVVPPAPPLRGDAVRWRVVGRAAVALAILGMAVALLWWTAPDRPQTAAVSDSSAEDALDALFRPIEPVRVPISAEFLQGRALAIAQVSVAWEAAQRAAAPTLLDLRTQPAGAVVSLEGVVLGTSPLRAAVLPPRRPLVLVLESAGRTPRALEITEPGPYVAVVDLARARTASSSDSRRAPPASHWTVDLESGSPPDVAPTVPVQTPTPTPSPRPAADRVRWGWSRD